MPTRNSPLVGRRRVLQSTVLLGGATVVPTLAVNAQIVPEGTPMTDELSADEIRSLLELEPNATCGGQEVPPFIVAPALTVTKENVAQGWKDSLNREAPQSVLDAVK